MNETAPVIPTSGATEQEIRAFVGPNADYYVKQWAPALPPSGVGTGFNWAAALLAALWLPYRKLYAAACLLYGFGNVLGLCEFLLRKNGVELGTLRIVGWGVGIIVGAVCGAFGNRWYLARAEKVVAETRAQGQGGDSHLATLASRGGTNFAAAVGFFVADMAVLVAVLVAAQSVFFPSTFGKRQDSFQRDITLANARRRNPVEAVKQQLEGCINRYRRGDPRALPFLSSGATNISVLRVTRSGNTNLPSVDAVLLVDGKRHYLEIPISIFPTVFLETLPFPPTEAEIREHVNRQVQRALKGETSDLRLSSYYQWTNIVIESLIVPTNYTQSWPYRAEVVLSAQASGPNTGAPLQYRLHLDIRYMDEDTWLVSPKRTAVADRLTVGKAEEETVRNIPGWGTVTDPDGDCTFKTENGKVAVTVPGTAHDLNPYDNMNAPRILQEVEGDFTVQVKVSSDFDPGDASAVPGAVAFNGAGLLVWHTDKDYLRLERDIWVTPQGERPSYAPLFEYWKDDRNMNPHNGTLEPFFKGRSTYLRITRHHNVFTIAVSHDGTVWLAEDSVTTDLPEKIKVGVAAINTSKKPFTVEFAEFKVTTK